MKKYTLPLCGLAISLGMVSSAMAALSNGSQTISGTLSVPVCTVSMPTDFNIPEVHLTDIDGTAVYGNDILRHQVGPISIKNCGNVTASMTNPNGNDSGGAGTGRFAYENVTVKEAGQEPLFFKVVRNPVTGDTSRVENGWRMDGGNTVVLKDGDTLDLKMVRGTSPKGKLKREYIGNYSADLTFTFNYS